MSMKSEVLSALTGPEVLWFPLVTVVMFTTMFAAVLVWIFRRDAAAVYAERSRMIFDDDAGYGRQAPDRKEATRGTGN